MSSTRVTKVDVLNEVMLLIFRVSTRLLEKGDEMVAPLNLSSARWQVLGAVALAEQPLTAPQIGEAMGVSRQGVQKQLNRMLEEGLFEVLKNPRHERSPLYMLTRNGREAYDRVTALHRRWTDALAEHITRTGIDGMRDALDTLYVQLGLTPVPTLE
ncbi:MAG: MarR family transcriptional regulator [Xanthomonadaceae bacterium]|nr:MarR family transcriptional regulator [Xanthomonadaceae bacterium]